MIVLLTYYCKARGSCMDAFQTKSKKRKQNERKRKKNINKKEICCTTNANECINIIAIMTIAWLELQKSNSYSCNTEPNIISNGISERAC